MKKRKGEGKTHPEARKLIPGTEIEVELINIDISYGIKPLCFNWSFYKEERPHDFKWKPKKSCKQLF